MWQNGRPVPLFFSFGGGGGIHFLSCNLKILSALNFAAALGPLAVFFSIQ